jgi:hypothetical protein
MEQAEGNDSIEGQAGKEAWQQPGSPAGVECFSPWALRPSHVPSAGSEPHPESPAASRPVLTPRQGRARCGALDSDECGVPVLGQKTERVHDREGSWAGPESWVRVGCEVTGDHTAFLMEGTAGAKAQR